MIPLVGGNAEQSCHPTLPYEQTEEMQQHMAAMIESAEDAILSKGLNGIVRSWNPAAERMLGYRAEEMIGESVLRLLPEDRLDEELMILDQIRRGQRVAHFETVRRRKNGSRLDVSLTISPIRNRAGIIVGASKVMRDITERRRTTRELCALNSRLEERVAERTEELASAYAGLAQKNEEVEAFVYIVSHDLRAPLVNIQGFSGELARSCGSLEESLRHAALPADMEDTLLAVLRDDMAGALRYINASAMKFERLIDTLLLLSRTGKQELRFEEMDVSGVVATTLLSFRQAIQKSGAEVTVEALPGMTGDITAISQVFSNLISNALKYLKSGEPGHIVIGGETVSGVTHYWVRDNGAGIPASAQQRLFRVFQRFHPDLASGDGMGLAIVKRSVERHGGRVWAESEEGIGTTFHFDLPAAGDARRK